MIKYILNPNLPEGNVMAVICGTEDKSILDFFSERGIVILKNLPNKDIDPSVSTHADMAAFHIGKNRIIVYKKQLELNEQLSDLGFEVLPTDAYIAGDYPEDVKLNFASVGNYVIGNFALADKQLLDNISDKSFINVKQGYSKCSLLVVNESSVITDDVSIYNNSIKSGLNALLISKGDVFLDGHEYGFIGGASGKISKDTVVFFGDITKHRDFYKIEDFLSENGCNFVCTDEGKLRDIGGFVSLTEE